MKKASVFFNFFILAMVAGHSNAQQLNTLTQAEKKLDKLAAKPPMGYNSFDSYGIADEETSKKLIDVMAEKYLPFGYDCFVLDFGWYYEEESDKYITNENGVPEPSKKLYPNGIKSLADYAHQKGLKFGLHLMRGVLKYALDKNCKVKGTDILLKDIIDPRSICTWANFTIGVDMSKPGAQEYYNSIIDKLASWGVDFIKYDDITGQPKEINAVVKAIEQNGRPIVLSLSPGEDTRLENLPYYQKSNILRITSDIWDNQLSLDRSFKAMKEFQGRGFPGFWPDLDMIALGSFPRRKKNEKNLFTNNQAQTLITQRAIFASPLIIGGDLLTMDDFTHKLLTNKDMLACNQNGVTGFQIFNKDSTEIYLAPNKTADTKGWVAIFNRKSRSQTIKLKKSDFGFEYFREVLNVLVKDYRFHDIWNQKDLVLKKFLQFTIPATGVLFAEYSEL